jgi:hypothetical protein
MEKAHVADSELADKHVDVFLELIRIVSLQQLLPTVLDVLTPRLQVSLRIEEFLLDQADDASQDLLPVLPAKHHLIAGHYLNSTGEKESPTSVNPAQ